MTETTRIADQLRRAFHGDAWHGDALLEILEGVSAAQASARSIPHAHTIWELMLHIAAWDGAVRRRLGGEALELSDEQNFPPVKDTSETTWRKAVDRVRQVHDELVHAVSEFPDARLDERVPGKQGSHYTYYYMLHGIAQHEAYHAGQIALLKKK
jgi:uncharacterized damage-inducible protein DinB